VNKMSLVLFDQEKKFKCPCGCKKTLTLSIQQTEDYGWNAFVSWIKDGKWDFIAVVGENHIS
jgi:hypothetical protein